MSPRLTFNTIIKVPKDFLFPLQDLPNKLYCNGHIDTYTSTSENDILTITSSKLKPYSTVEFVLSKQTQDLIFVNASVRRFDIFWYTNIMSEVARNIAILLNPPVGDEDALSP